MKKRTQNKFYNAIIGAIRIAFARYSPQVGQLMANARVEIPKKNKDGSLSKRPEVWSKCNICKKLTKKIEIDHIGPVVEIGKTYKDYTWDELIQRIDCNLENLQVICPNCHKDKTKQEREKRK